MEGTELWTFHIRKALRSEVLQVFCKTLNKVNTLGSVRTD